MATEQHGFSTGVLLIGAAGNTSLVPTLTVTVNGAPTGGTFYLQLGNQVTAGIAYNAAASAVQSALNAISNGFGATVTGSNGGPYTVQLLTPLFSLSANGAALTGGTTPSVSVSIWTLPKIGDVQDGGLDITYTEREVMTDAAESVFGTDAAFHGGKAVSNITVEDLNRLLLTTILNAVKTTANSIDTFTIAATTVPIFFRSEFYGIDTNGKFIYWCGTRCYSKGFQDSYKLQDITQRKFDINMIADPAATGANGYGTVLVLSQGQ